MTAPHYAAADDRTVETILSQLTNHLPTTEPGQQDPVDAGIEYALRHSGWQLLPNIGFGLIEHAIMRHHAWHTDLISIPDMGYFTITRLLGRPTPDHPRRPAHIEWTHLVPPHIAVTWLLTDATDDHTLTEWQQHPEPEP